MTSPVSKTETRVLRHIRDALRHFDGCPTSSSVPLRTVRKLIARGLVESIGMGVLCDGDGFTIQPERCRELYRLTVPGWEWVEKDWKVMEEWFNNELCGDCTQQSREEI